MSSVPSSSGRHHKRRKRPRKARPKKHKKSKFTLEVPQPNADPWSTFLFTAGNGPSGQLGLGVFHMETDVPMWLKMDYKVINTHAGANHSVCLTEEGQVLTFGNNDHGQLGRDTSIEGSAIIPTAVRLPGRAKEIAAGEFHTVVLLENGCVYAWGDFKDSEGMMGLALSGGQRLPILICAFPPVVKIASGANHFAVLTREGEICTVGCGERGQLGRIPQMRWIRESREAFQSQLKLLPIFQDASRKLRFDSIWAGGNCTLAKVARSSDIYAFGCNRHKQLCIDTHDTLLIPTLSPKLSQRRWKDIKCGETHTLALTTDARVYVVGHQANGGLGLGDGITEVDELTQVNPVNNQEILAIGVGHGTSFASVEETGLLAWGTGTSGQLGIGDNMDHFLPVECPARVLENMRIIRISGGATHTLILAHQVGRK